MQVLAYISANTVKNFFFFWKAIVSIYYESQKCLYSFAQ